MARGLIGIEHVGIVPRSQKAFEQFWCDTLGFKRVREGSLPSQMTEALFAISGGASTVRYTIGLGADLEIHTFPTTTPACGTFDQEGINHVCILVEDKRAFLESLPANVRVHEYQNPKGWVNAFVLDPDGNWVEIREVL